MHRVFELSGKQHPEDSKAQAYIENENMDHAADPVIRYIPKEKIRKLIRDTAKAMEEAVKQLDFLEAARLRDELFALKKALPDSENS
jgi:excinuclease ABC subunit B